MKPVSLRLLVSPECFASRMFVTPALVHILIMSQNPLSYLK